jgi:hypothetical protein
MYKSPLPALDTSMRSKKAGVTQAEREQFLAEIVVRAARTLSLEVVGIPALGADPRTCSRHSIRDVCLACRHNLCRKCGKVLGQQVTVWSGDCGLASRHTAFSEGHQRRVMRLVQRMQDATGDLALLAAVACRAERAGAKALRTTSSCAQYKRDKVAAAIVPTDADHDADDECSD